MQKFIALYQKPADPDAFDEKYFGTHLPLVDRTHLVKAKEWARAPLRGKTLREIAALRHELRAEHYDLCIDLQGAVRSALAGRLAGTTRMIGEDQPREWPARTLVRWRLRPHSLSRQRRAP